MASVGEFTIPSDAFPLGILFAELPDVTVELERIVPTNHALIPYVWVRGASPIEEDQIEETAGRHADVKNVTLIDEVNDKYLLRIEWVSHHEGVLRAITETGVTLLSGVGSKGTWTFEVRSDAHGGISEFQEYCHDHDIPAELASLHSMAALKNEAEHGLTDTQREALLLAYERGYYRSPREISLEELASEVGITGQSFGSRLRRGIHRLIGNTLTSSSD